MASALSVASDPRLDNGHAREDELDDQDAKEHTIRVCVLIGDLATEDDFIVTPHGRNYVFGHWLTDQYPCTT